MQQGMWPVDVISLFGADGELRPLRVRAREGMEETLVGNVSEILRTREIHRVGAESHSFLCRIRCARSTIVMELRFFVRTHSWYMSRPEL